MDQQMVDELEEELTTAIATALKRAGADLPRSRRTLHLMAKAAVAVYEAASATPPPRKRTAERR